MSDAAPMGHNSLHASPEELAALVRRAKRADVLEVKIKDLDGKIKKVTKENEELRGSLERASGTLNTISAIGETGLSATAKTIATHLAISAMHTGEGKVSTKQLQTWASLRDRQSVPRALEELTSARLLEVAQRPTGRNPQYTVRLASDADLQAIVEGLRTTAAGNVCSRRVGDDGDRSRGSNPQLDRSRGSNPQLNPVGEGKTLSYDRSRGKNPQLTLDEGKTLSYGGETTDNQTSDPHTDSVRTLYSEENSNNSTLTTTTSTSTVTARDGGGGVWSDDPYYRMLRLSGDRNQIIHPQFRIPVEAVFLAITAANPKTTREEIFQICLAEAITWATNLDIGQPVTKAVPDHIVRWITAVVQKGNIRKQVGDVQIARAGKSPQNVPNWHKRPDPRGSMRDS